MISIKVFGTTPPCARCKKTEKRAKNVAAKYPHQVEVTKFDALSAEGDKYGVMSTPTVVVNEKVVSVGKLPTEEELARIIKREMEAA